ncbi:RNA polymerase sigma factor [Actinomadura rupiterrae]|uniref:RNA polymerase sigma factor n=1 Tax=Actinomadura rupiterrae TaxID=559627 RepID=UPI0020A579DA|nr:sigma-70 family RNA polymerase sigma factor [Actinomadura rupiterrae]MCP2343742.1 RNA polymerase sigma factor (sigma-70 family) [Actinomadura rupiterrae]
MAAWAQTMAALADRRGAALKRYAFLLCGDDAEADDLVQEALVRAFARPGRRTQDEAEGYVRRIMLNRFLDGKRSRRVWRRVSPLVHGKDYVPDASAQVVVNADVRAALARLSPRQRACAVLRYYEDLTVAQIAAQLGCREGSVKRYLSEAHQRLAELLGDGETADEGRTEAAAPTAGARQPRPAARK